MRQIRICEINKKNIHLFEPFIPDEYFRNGIAKNQAVIGFFNEEMALGAAVLEVSGGVTEILSLVYREEWKEGSIEKALTRFILGQNWNIHRIRYIVDGTEVSLGNYDLLMLAIGYVPAKGPVKRYHTQLGVIYDRQRNIIEKYKKHYPKRGFINGANLTADQIHSYNTRFPYAMYTGCDSSDILSCFFIEDGDVLAAVIAQEDSDGILEFMWMDADELTDKDKLNMIFHVICNACAKYPPATEVVICPYLDEVAEFMARFGFTEESGSNETRIYTYYI